MSKHLSKNIDRPGWIEIEEGKDVRFYSMWSTKTGAGSNIVANGFVQGEPGKHRAEESE